MITITRSIGAALLATAALSVTAQDSGPAPESLFERITQSAAKLAKRPYAQPGHQALPDAFSQLNYSQYRDIRFEKNRALWRGSALFNVEFFHPGFLYREPVTIHEVVNGQVRRVPFRGDWFDYGKNGGVAKATAPDLGYVGFRIHYPLNRADYQDELLVFLGASYLRMVGRGQVYGLSARGLAVDTASAQGEEFPRFSEFWLERPAADATRLVFYALLDSKSVTGAYRFELIVRGDPVLDVQARLFARSDVGKLGVAPLTSMFLFGTDRVRHFDDYRPQVHDSDGLSMLTGAGEWIWRPLHNPTRLRVSSLLDRGPQGFGLLQRERDFEQYLDMETRYDNRPSYWVTPQGDWSKGRLQLIEIPTPDETNDNIVAFWVPDAPFKAGQRLDLRYQLHATATDPAAAHLATVRRTRVGWAAIPGASNPPPRSKRVFKIDFQGGELRALDAAQPVQADLTVSVGEVSDLAVLRLPEDQGWRVSFKLNPERDSPADMRLFLTLQGQRLSETWTYLWSPEVLEGK
jgi:periplasmic glucans biosynthesis protein